MASRAIDNIDTESAANDVARATREWWTAAELAELALPGLPADKRSINRRAQEERWSMRDDADGAPLVRPRAGRGGGVEFHVSLLPGTARLEMARRGLTGARPAPTPVETDKGGWCWYESQSDAVHAEAERRLLAVQDIALLEESGMTRTAAIADVAARRAVGKATLWNWLRLVEGVAPHDRLPALAPRRKGGGRAAEIDPAIWLAFKSDYLRGSEPTLTSCYERVEKIATKRGLSLPSEKTFRRRLEAEVDPAIILLRRKGDEALRRSVPSNRMTVDHLHAMQWVNIDGHKFDVFVTPPDGGKPTRPIMVALQDIRSSKIVGWRLGLVESTALARLAIADMLQQFGIPQKLTTDNGRGFAGKWLTGGYTGKRFRFKKFDNEPTGLLTELGIDIKFALPYRGQSKPIERAFRDLTDRIARAPECEGAYTGPNPQEKPHNYGKRAMAWSDFVAHVRNGIIAHNARLGRTGRDYRGRSFDQVFAESYATAPIGKATEEHLRLALLAAERVRVDRRTGEIRLFGNRYWAEGCGRLHGRLVTVRFDPDNLDAPIHLYEGRTYLMSAAPLGDVRWGDADGAKSAAKRVSDYRRRVRDGLEAEQLLAAEELAALQVHPGAPDLPPPTVVRAVRHRGHRAAALKAVPDPRPDLARDKTLDRMAQGLRHLKAVD